MINFTVRRVLQSVVVLVGVTLIVFLLIHLLPGGPARALLGPKATPAQVQQFIRTNGYDHPFFVQYWDYLVNLLQGKLGYSYEYNATVASLLADNIPKTAVLVGLAYAVALLIAIPIGLVQAAKRNSLLDHAISGASFVAYSMPVFWLATLLILWFAVSLHVFPSEGPQGATVGADFADPRALVLPVASLALVTVALLSRFVRSSAVANLIEDYVRTARAKGVGEARVLFRHVLRNALTPMVTLLGLSLPGVISGAVVVESVYNYNGMGLLLWKAATTHDYPVLMGFTVVVGAVTVLSNLLADLLYAAVDPRVHYGGRPE